MLSLFLSLSVILNAAVPVDCLLHAIRQVEAGDNPTLVGTKGERGAYQFRRSTWEDRTSASFWRAHDPKTAEEVAKKHLYWIRRALQEAGIANPTDWQVAAAWNAGVGAVAGNAIPVSTWRRANRVINLAEAYAKDQSDPLPTPLPRLMFTLK